MGAELTVRKRERERKRECSVAAVCSMGLIRLPGVLYNGVGGGGFQKRRGRMLQGQWILVRPVDEKRVGAKRWFGLSEPPGHPLLSRGEGHWFLESSERVGPFVCV